MLNTTNVHTARRDRLIKGADNWWFLGPGGIAKILPHHLDPAGELLPSAEAHLRAAGLYETPAPSVYSLTVLTSTDCNLGCAYCFQNTGQDPTGGSRPPRITHSRLTSESIGKVLDFAGQQMAAEGFQRLSIMLFGGEPLLNLKGAKELLTRAADYGMKSASMISNGVLLTPVVARELADRGLRSVQITFDGDQADHDGIRVRRSGGGTFDVIIDNIVRASEATALRWNLRVNVSHLNHAGVDTLIDRLAERVDPARCHLAFARVGDVGVGFANELLHEDQLISSFIGWNRKALQRGFATASPKAVPVCQACSYKNGQYGAVVNADGTLYSCWETSGRPGFQVGSIEQGYLPDEATEGRWLTCLDKYQFSEETSTREAFGDLVDAALLDDLSAAGHRL
jgi:uncharacterized protein